MRKLNSERIVKTPWVSRPSLQVSTRAVHTYFNQAILILQNSGLIEMNDQNEFQITHRGIADLEIMERQ
jgi:predicted transcriptional regulator